MCIEGDLAEDDGRVQSAQRAQGPAGDRVRPAPPIAEAREVMWVRGPAPLMAEARETRGSGEAGEVNSSPGPVSQVSSRAMVTTWPRARARHPRSVGGDHVITGVNESHF